MVQTQPNVDNFLCINRLIFIIYALIFEVINNIQSKKSQIIEF